MNIDFKTFNTTDYPYLDDSYVDKYIPVMYGKIAAVEITPINSNYDTDNDDIAAVYRLPVGTSDYGTAYVEIDDTWTAATVTKVDYDTGLLTISNGRASSGSTYTCKIVDCYGYMFSDHCYPRQAMQHWYATYGGIQYTSSNFDKDEWENQLDDSRYQADFGLLLDDYSRDDDSDASYDLDYFNETIYNMSTFGGLMYARVDYNAEGKRTARLLDYDRDASDTIPSAEIYNNGEIKGSTTGDTAYTSIIEKYYYNDVEDSYLSLEDSTYEKYVKQNYRIMQSKTDKSYLVNKADALTRAANLALIFRDIPIEFTVAVRDRYLTRLYDVVTISLMPDNLDSSMRTYAGNHDCLVTGVSPNISEGYTELTVQIIPDRTASEQQASIRSDAYTTVARNKSSVQLITDDLATQIDDNLLLTGSLSLVSINLSATAAGVVSDFSAATGTFNVTYSGTDVTGAGPVYSVVSQTGCTGTIDADTGVYAVSALSADVGILLLKAAYEDKSIQTSFTVTKAYTGTAGADGTDGESISVSASSNVLTSAEDGTLSPSTITVSATKKVGSESSTAYEGRFVISESTDGTTYTDVYTSVSNESSYEYTPTAGIAAALVELYASGGTTTFLDQQGIGVVSSGSGYSVFLENGYLSFLADSDGNLDEQSQTIKVTAYNGTTAAPFKIVSATDIDGATLEIVNGTVVVTADAGTSMPENSNAIITVRIFAGDIVDALGESTANVLGVDASSVLGWYVESDGDVLVSVAATCVKILAAEAGNSYEIRSSNSAFEKNRDGEATPSSTVYTTYRTVGDADPVSYAGRIKIYTSSDGETFTQVYFSSSDESSVTYSIPDDLAAIKTELYRSGNTGGPLSTLTQNIYYSEEVSAAYRGIGELSALSTQAFTSATVDSDGTITVGDTVSNVITGDTIVNYTGDIDTGLYYWSGTAWVATSDTAYFSEGANNDILALKKADITLDEWTAYVNLLVENLFVVDIELQNKLYHGEGNYANSDTPIFLGLDNSVAKFSLSTKLQFDGTDLTVLGNVTTDEWFVNSESGAQIKPICNLYFTYESGARYLWAKQNVDSLTRNGTGDYTINLTNSVELTGFIASTGTTYAAIVTAISSASDSSAVPLSVTAYADVSAGDNTVNEIDIGIFDSSGNRADPDTAAITIIGGGA